MDPHADEPTGGWDSVLTKDYLDSRLAVFERQVIRDFRSATVRLVVWTIAAAVAGMAVATGLVATLD
jgi:hypothetical protein